MVYSAKSWMLVARGILSESMAKLGANVRGIDMAKPH